MNTLLDDMPDDMRDTIPCLPPTLPIKGSAAADAVEIPMAARVPADLAATVAEWDLEHDIDDEGPTGVWSRAELAGTMWEKVMSYQSKIPELARSWELLEDCDVCGEEFLADLTGICDECSLASTGTFPSVRTTRLPEFPHDLDDPFEDVLAVELTEEDIID
jgi:hypothetical protein